jgi:predicted tellurium resistance membrane protein TerC
VGGLAHGNLELLAIGLFISIALLMVGSAVVAELIGRLPVLLDLAALTLGWTGASMVLHDHYVGPYLSGIPYANVLIPAAGVALVLAVDIVLRVGAARRRLRSQPTGQPAERPDETPATR